MAHKAPGNHYLEGLTLFEIKAGTVMEGANLKYRVWAAGIYATGWPAWRKGLWRGSAMDVATERQGDILAVLVSGRIDGSNAAAFEESVRTAIADSDRAAIMDLEKLSYISSSGLRVLLVIAKSLSGRDAKLLLCAMADPIGEVIETSGFDKIISVYPSKAEALASLDG